MNAPEPFIRLTVLGGNRAVDLVLPSGHTSAVILPELMELLEFEGDVTRYGLFTIAGHYLDNSVPLAKHKLRDGQQLRLLPVQDAPAEPVVHDVVDRIVGARRLFLWDSTTSPWIYGIFTAALMLTGAWFIPGTREVPLMVLGGLLLFGIVMNIFGMLELTWSFIGAGIIVALAGPIVAFKPSDPFVNQVALWWIPAALAIIVALGIVTKKVRSALAAGLLLAILAGIGWLLMLFDVGREQTGAILAALALICVGVLPRIAMMGSGLYAIADRIADGQEHTVSQVDAAVGETYGAFTATLAVLSGVIGFGLAALTPAVFTNYFAMGTLLSLALAALLRSRHFPLAIHRLMLPGAITAAIISIASSYLSQYPKDSLLMGFVFIGVSILVLALPLLTTSSPVCEAHGRKIADSIERVCIIASIPCIVGMFGLYAELLRTFQ